MKTQIRSLIFIISFGLILSILSCSKEEMPTTPTGKMPITTNSPAALRDFLQARTYSDKLQQVKAAGYYQMAVDKDPAFAFAWLNLAFVSAGTNSFLAALDSAVKYIDTVSEAEQIQIKSTESAVSGNSIEQAALLMSLVEKYPGDERAHNLLGNYQYGLQQYQLAIKSYSNAITINPDLAAAYNMLGYAQRSLGNYGEAEKALKFYTRLNPKNPNAFDSYAELLLEMGRYYDSIEFYNQALGVDSTFMASHIGIATNYNFLGEGEKARAQLKILKENAQNHVIMRQAIIAKAISYLFEGKLLKSIEQIELSLQLTTDNNDIANISADYAILGNLYLGLGQFETALLNFNRAIQVINESHFQPGLINNAQAGHYYNIARAYAAIGDFRRADQAVKVFDDMAEVRENPTQIALSHQLQGIVALYKEEYQEAIDLLEQANELNPRNLYRIGQAYDGLGNHEQATIMMQRGAELNVLNSFDQAYVIHMMRKKAES